MRGSLGHRVPQEERKHLREYGVGGAPEDLGSISNSATDLRTLSGCLPIPGPQFPSLCSEGPSLDDFFFYPGD